MTQADIGDIAGVSDKAVSTWENGTAEPRMGAIQRIADYFGLKKSDIIDGDLSHIEAKAEATNVDILTEINKLSPEQQELIFYYLKGVLNK